MNIDMHFFSDERVEYLAQAIGEDRLMTEGRLLRIWASCYRDRTPLRWEIEVNRAGRWLDPKRSLMNMLVAADLADEDQLGRVRIRGVESRIAYLVEAAEAGKRSAAARKKKYGTALPKNAANRPKAPPPKVPSNSTEGPPKVVSKPAELLPLPLPPNTNTSKELRSFATGKLEISDSTGVATPRSVLGGQAIVKTYVDAFRLRYKTSPAIDGACRGEVKRLLDGVGAERACMLVQAYLQLEDPKYLAKCHDLTSLRMDLQRVSVALDQGRQKPNEKTWQEIAAEQEGK